MSEEVSGKMRRAPKFSERDLDDDFERFLKESLSDDSMDSDKLNKNFAKSRREEQQKKMSQPWWMQEEKEEEEDTVAVETGKEDKTPTTSKWLKPKKQSTPVTDKDEQSDRKQRESTKGYDEADSFKKKSHFSKDSLEDLSTVDRKDDKLSMQRERSGVIPSHASFEDTLSYTETGTSEGLTPASTGAGMETLEEQADKERFFKDLEAKRGGIVDYHKLIKEPDMSNTMGSLRSANLDNTMGSLPSAYMGTADEHSSPLPFKQLPRKENLPREDKRNDEYPSTTETSPSQLTVHPHGQVASPKKGMLAKVALLDTGDSMLNTTGQVGEATAKLGGGDGMATGDMRTASAKNQMLDTSSGLLGAGTATEMEALQAALREAANTPTMDFSHTGGATDEAMDNEGQLRTIDDIMREVNAERGRMFKNGDGIPSRLMDQNETSESTTRRRRNAADEPDYEPGNEHSELKAANESRGFDLLPANESRGFDLEPTNESRRFDLQPANESRGFDLQPANESTGFDLQPANDNRGFDLQPANESRGFDLQPANESRGFDLEPSNENRGFELQPATAPSGKFDPSSASADDENSQLRIAAKPSKKVISKKAGTKPTSSRYAHIRGTGYGKPKPADAWSPAEAAKQKIKGSEVPSLQDGSGQVRGSIMASVESFAHYIHEHFADIEQPSTPKERPIRPRKSAEEPLLAASLRETRLALVSRERALVGEVSEWQARWKEEHKLNGKLRAEVAAGQREAARRAEEQQLNHQREVFKLRQDNTVLQAKLNIHDEQQNGTKRALSGRALEGASQEEEIKLMQKEIVEQETLLQGYQQENERLYNEVRKLQKYNSEGEERLQRDNHRLQTEVANQREVLEQKDVALRHKGLITGTKVQQEIAAGNNTAVLGAGRITELQVELREAEMREASVKQRLRQTDDVNKELKEHIENLVRDKSHSQVKLQDLRDVKQREFQDMQQQYQREIEGLSKKLRWYAENQEMLDKDANALREKNEEIKRLKEALEKVNKQTNQKSADAQRRAKERAVDAKRIQDLERQVREMNDIIRRRHPNSLPALIYAAASAPGPDPAQDGSRDPARATPAKSHTVAFLEEKVRKMEAELDEKEAETKTFARVLEQKYNNMRFQYEDRLQALEKQLRDSKQRHQEAATANRIRPPVLPQSGEAWSAPEARRKAMEDMREENEELRRRLDETARVAQTDAEAQRGEGTGKGVDDNRSLRMKLTSLAKELSNKDHEIKMLKATCGRLMQEQCHAMTAGDSTRVKDKPQPTKKSKRTKSSSSSQSGEKHYQPENFSGTHISDVLTENKQLTQQLEQLALEMEQQRVGSQASLAQGEGAIRRAHEEAAERLAALRASHAAEMEKLVAGRALEHADSRHAKLVGQLDTQQVMIKHLQEQLLEARVDTDSLSAARVREQLFKTQVEQLNEDLREAKKSHTPEMRHFEALQAKIATMDARHAQREQELQQLVARARCSGSYEKDQEIAGYQQVLAAKNRELQQFRQELDAILEVLRELQRQGVVLPLRSHTVQSLLN